MRRAYVLQEAGRRECAVRDLGWDEAAEEFGGAEGGRRGNLSLANNLKMLLRVMPPPPSSHRAVLGNRTIRVISVCDVERTRTARRLADLDGGLLA